MTRMDVIFYVGLAISGFGAGLLGALLGLGGGVFLVPALQLIFNVPPLVSIGTSNVAVVATSTAGASVYVRDRLANIRLALVLLISTTAAALVASLLASRVPEEALQLLFAVVLCYVAFTMLRNRGQSSAAASSQEDEDTTTRNLGLATSYYDAAKGRAEFYSPVKVRTGMGASTVAGVI